MDEMVAKRIQEEEEIFEQQKKIRDEYKNKEVPVIQENVEEPVIVKEEEITKPVKKTRKRRKIVARKRRFSQATTMGDDEDSEYEKEKEQLSLCLTIASDEDKEVDYEILDQKSPIIEWKSEYYGLKPMPDEVEVPEEINVNVVTRRNGSKRYFSLFLNALSVFDREDLCALYQLVIDKYQDEIPQSFDRIIWGDLITMFHPIELDKTDSDMIIYMLVEKKYPLMKKILLQMLKGLLVAGKCALWFGNLEARNEDEKGCLSLATPEQTATGKEISNPLIADSLLKTIGSSMHLVTAMKH
ncbi:hypothetical protein Tco_0844585 [Tanacetum coccineum]